MSATNLLNQLLKAGTDLLQNKSAAPPADNWQQNTNNAPQNQSSPLGSLAGLLSGKGGAALAGGALGLLLGSKKGRKMGGTLLTYGGLAAVGAIAYKAYGNWQSQQTANPGTPQTIDRVPPAQAEQHSRAILIALIAAAKADGHVDERERQLIDGEIAKLTQDQTLLNWVDQELKKPLDPAAIAAVASTPEIAAEMYLASILVIDEENFMERAYLQELAKQLQLAPELQSEISNQAKQALQLCN